MQRGRAKTEQQLIEAVGQIIAEEGYNQLGINRISNRAGINKILIYRYFGGLDGLLDAYMQQVRPKPVPVKFDIKQLRTASLEKIFDACSDYLIAEYRQLRQDTQTQELLRAELLGLDVPTNPLLLEKRRRFRIAIDQIGELLQTPYGPAYAAFLHSALTMLTLQGQQNKSPVGLDLASDESWEQIEAVVRHILRGAYLQVNERLSNAASAGVCSDSTDPTASQ